MSSKGTVKAAKIGGCTGFILAALVLAYGYVEPHIHAPAINDWLIFGACPSSIVLMATESGKWYVFVVAGSITVVVNAIWYAFIFFVAAKLFGRDNKADVSTTQIGRI